MNNITLHGRLTRDVEERVTSSGSKVYTFAVAVNRSSDYKKTDFFECVSFGKSGEFIQKHFNKGKEIVLSGEMRSNKYQDRDGKNVTTWSVAVEHAEFCGTLSQGNNSKETAGGFYPVDEDADEDDTPF